MTGREATGQRPVPLPPKPSKLLSGSAATTGRQTTVDHAYDCRCKACEREAAAEWVRMHDSWGVLDDPAPSGREAT